MRRILVPLDGTGAAEAAVKEIEAICEPGDEVVLISVSPPTEPSARGSRPGKVVSTGTIAPGIIGGAPGPDRPVAAETATQAAQRQADEMRDYLEDRASPLRGRGFKVQTVALTSDKPADAIVDYARRMHPTFIAMLRRSHRTLGEILFGTVAQAVIRAEVAPVLVVPAKLD